MTSRKTAAHNSTQDIAVIGLACQYPGASNVRDLWENILARRVQFRRMPDDRLPISEYYDQDPKAPEKTYANKAALLENFKFDWAKLRIPKKTFESTDIVHWLALDVALKTFDDAGFKPGQIPIQNTGVIVGNTLTGEQTRSQTLRLRWPYVQKILNLTLSRAGLEAAERGRIAVEMEEIFKSAFYPITEDSLAGGLSNTIAGRICNYLNLKGGGYVVDGACSSSLLAVATAANALRSGDLDLALAGGVDVSLDPFELVGFAKAGALAKDRMSVYDNRANGFVPGEGCGFVLMKRLEDAVRDGNYVYAVVKGWGISSDGKGGIMEPSSTGQALAIQRAYREAPYKVSDVRFIEGHGTGTTKGDRVELEGIATAIRESGGAHKSGPPSCGVTSFKSIVGHTKAAAGVGGFIKAVLAVNQRVLPPTANCTEPNDVFKEKANNLHPILRGQILDRALTVRGGISSAGFGGINCHVTLESGDEPSRNVKPGSDIDERALFASNQESEIFVFSAPTRSHLQSAIRRFKDELRNISVAEMADLAALLNRRVKQRFPIRGAVVTDTPENLYAALLLAEKELEKSDLVPGQILRIDSGRPGTLIFVSNDVKKCRVGFLYPGQASQRPNMARRLTDRFEWVRDLLALADSATRSGVSTGAGVLATKMFWPDDRLLSAEEAVEFDHALSETSVTQPAVTFGSLAWTQFLSRLGVEPHSAGGHSLGELTAFYTAGALDEKSLLKFAADRGAAMASSGARRGVSEGGMAALFCSERQAEELVGRAKNGAVIANINGPRQIAVSGPKKAVEEILVLAKKDGISGVLLSVSSGFHSPLMKDAAAKIKTAAYLKSAFSPSDVELYSCMTGEKLSGKMNLKNYFADQMLSPVRFTRLVEEMSKKCDLFLEVGPGRVLSDLVKAIHKDGGVACLPVESTAGNDRDLNAVLAELFVRGANLKWVELYQGRLIRPFVPASRKRFIQNQCERPVKIGDQVIVLKKQQDTGSSDRQAIAPPSIRAHASNGSGVKNNSAASQSESGAGRGSSDIAALLIQLTHKMTGFDLNSITLESRLLDDLNLDSIKAAELIGEAARALGVAGQIEPSQLSNHTLAQIRDRLQELAPDKAASNGVTANETSPAKLSHRDSWVRDFVMRFEPEEIAVQSVVQAKKISNAIIVSSEPDSALAHAIAKKFGAAKIPTRILTFDGIPTDRLAALGNPNGMIFILPKTGRDFSPNAAELKRRIQMLHKAAALCLQSAEGQSKTAVFVQSGGGAQALASTLHLERPDLRLRILDFDEALSPASIADKISAELKSSETFSIAAYDARARRLAPVYRNSEPASYRARNILWSAKDTVLVTGGAKGITAECALEFARNTKVRMILVGKSPAPKNPNDSGNEITRTLQRFASEDLSCEYRSCDITNESEVQALVKSVRGIYGPITGLIHGAGLNALKRLKQADPQEAYEQALPKVIGALNLLNVLRAEPPKLVLAMTSIIGVTGMEGSGWYGFANEMLNLLLERYKAEMKGRTQVQAIAYSVWDEVGMGVRLGSIGRLHEKGIAAIPVAEGVRHFMKLAQFDPGPGAGQTIVTARLAGLDTWRSPAAPDFRAKFRFIEDVQYHLPGVELVARCRLNIQDDPYLLDHDWKGSLLFPFVFGFEAMAQAVATAAGRERLTTIRATDINLERPIPVNRDTGTVIEVRAEFLTSEKSGAHARVKAAVHSEQDGFSQPLFSAIFELGGEEKKSHLKRAPKVDAKKDTGLDPANDLYGPILFQGKMFQRIKKVHSLQYDPIAKTGTCSLTTSYLGASSEIVKTNRKFSAGFLTADPFVIDSMLQSMQAIITQEMSLPRSIESIEVNCQPNSKTSSEMPVATDLKLLDENHFMGNSAADAKSGIFLKIANCRLKILNIDTDRPSANDLVNPARRDLELIDDKIIELSKHFGLHPPVVKCMTDPRLTTGQKQSRRAIEIPLMKSAVNALIERDHKLAPSLSIKWLRSGKPVVSGAGTEEIGISLTNKGPYAIVVAGYGDQGCDLEDLQNKSTASWKALLGSKKHQIALDLQKKHDISEDYACTALWCANEAISKYAGENPPKIDVLNVKDRTIVFSSDLTSGCRTIVFPLRLTRGPEKILSLVTKADSESTVHTDANPIARYGYHPQDFAVSVEHQDGLTFVKNFPVTFRNGQTASRGVGFTSYFNWMGDVREHGITPILRKLAVLMESGEWGIATNHSTLEIMGDLRTSDTVQTKVIVEDIVGDRKAVYDMVYEWRKQGPQGFKELVALGKQRVSWVKILGHGLARVEAMPTQITTFMQQMLSPAQKGKKYPPGMQHSLGKKVIALGPKEMKEKVLLERIFNTTSEESNLVGNVYFANYTKWAGVLKDLYFYKIDPSSYINIGKSGELDVVTFNITYLNEAMPFDTIRARMFLKNLYENGMDLFFEFHKLAEDGTWTRLATADMSALWRRLIEKHLMVEKLPEMYLSNFLHAI